MTTVTADRCATVQPRLAYGPADAAKLLSISRDEVYNLLRAGQIGSYKYGRRRLIPYTELVRYIERMMSDSPDQPGG